MIRADTAVMEAMNRMMRAEPNFKMFVKWLNESREARRTEMESAKDADTMRQMQGACRELSEILEVISQADNMK